MAPFIYYKSQEADNHKDEEVNWLFDVQIRLFWVV